MVNGPKGVIRKGRSDRSQELHGTKRDQGGG